HSMNYDAIIISDVHLGAYNCQTSLLLNFLEKIHNKEIKTDKLIIDGDLFDSFNSRLNKDQWKVLGKLRSISNDLQLIWIKGNHDSYTSASTVAHIIGAEF